jgi:DNA-binding winged helix-turn-helix (wHTH) protein/tetratricopeptide (TPR) repeat protein
MIHVFGKFELDEELYELRRAGQVVKVEPQAFDMLAYLLHNRQRVVSKEELLEKLWPGEFVSESALSYCIKAARRAVEDTGDEQRVIKTFHGRGYRFVAEVEGVRPAAVAAAAPAGVAAERAAAAAFVGRRSELDALAADLDDVLAGRGRVVMLVGGPGIGKTRTAEQVAAQARARGARVLIGRCYEGEGAPAFWPWVQIVRAYAQDCDPVVLRQDLGSAGPDIAQLVPAVARRLPDLPPPVALEPEQARFRLFDGVTAFLKSVARRAPLLLVLDDLHWADRASLLLLQFAAREVADVPVLILGCYRDIEVQRAEPLAEIAAALRHEPHYGRVVLRGLPEAEVGALLGTLVGPSVPEPFVHAIYRETEGNPFFVQEVVRHLVEEGILYREGDRWTSDLDPERMGIPEGVREVIWRRLARLGDACRRVLTVAAVVGREFELAPLARAWEAEAGGDAERARESVLGRLDEAVQARIVERMARHLSHYRFSHALIRETLLDEVASPDRIHLHRAVGEALEATYGADLEPHLVELAHHFVRAAPGGDAAKAVDYALRAAQRATRLLAYEEAVDHYERALEMMQLQHDADDVRRADVLLALGEAQWRAGETQRAKETFLRAATTAKQIGAAVHLAQAALGFGRPLRLTGLVDTTFIGLLEDALQALGDAETALGARTMARLAWALYGVPGSRPRRVRLSRQAVDMARRVGDGATLAWALHDRHWATWGPADLEDRLAVAGELVQIAQQLGNREMALQGHVLRVADLLELGDLTGVDAEIDAYSQLAGELRQPWYTWYVLRFQAMRALLDGRLADAEGLVEEALAAGRRVDAHAAELVHGWQIAALRIEQGRLGEMEPVLRALIAQYPALPSWRCALAGLTDGAVAQRELMQMAAGDFAAIPQDIFWLTAMALLAQSSATLGDAPRAALLYELLRPHAARWVAVGVAYACLGPVAYYLGLLAATLGRADDAIAHFAQACAAHARLPSPPWHAAAQIEWARALAARGRTKDRGTVRRLAAEAAASAHTLGLTALAARAEAVGRSLARA